MNLKNKTNTPRLLTVWGQIMNQKNGRQIPFTPTLYPTAPTQFFLMSRPSSFSSQQYHLDDVTERTGLLPQVPSTNSVLFVPTIFFLSFSLFPPFVLFPILHRPPLLSLEILLSFTITADKQLFLNENILFTQKIERGKIWSCQNIQHVLKEKEKQCRQCSIKTLYSRIYISTKESSFWKITFSCYQKYARQRKNFKLDKLLPIYIKNKVRAVDTRICANI